MLELRSYSLSITRAANCKRKRNCQNCGACYHCFILDVNSTTLPALAATETNIVIATNSYFGTS